MHDHEHHDHEHEDGSVHSHEHDHTDGHTDVNTHDHTHGLPAEPRLPPSRQGTVVLDIGDNVGALVVHTPDSLSGLEIEIARRGQSQAFTHTDVRERRLPDGSVYAGVFPALKVGDYTLLAPNGGAKHDVTITSGRVTEVTL